MHAEFIISIVLFSYLKSHANTKTLDPKWAKYFGYGIIMSVAILILSSSIHRIRPLMIWLTHFVIFGVAYLSQTEKEFKPLKPYAKVIIPLVAVHAVIDLLNFLPINGIDWLRGLFETAKSFVFIWFFATLVIVKRQQNALAKEKIKSDEQQKELEKTEIQSMLLERQVAERTLEITKQKEELVHALHDLKATQSQLIQAEKMASLGELTAGIAHEIQNPLNFVNNFSEVSTELIDEMVEGIENGDLEDVKLLSSDLRQNLEKIVHHGKRADGIVKGMLMHSRTNSDEKVSTDINALADEYLRLSYHGLRAKDRTFNAEMNTDFDESIENLMIVPQAVGRVILNLITNAFHAVTQRKASENGSFQPTVSVRTSQNNGMVSISISDNGVGIPAEIRNKIFQPFFTTKTTGNGTGLGLSLSYDIAKSHGGEILVKSEVGKGTEFIFKIPIGIKENNTR